MSCSKTKLKHVAGRGEYGLNFPASEYVADGVRLIRTTDLAHGYLSSADSGVYVPQDAVAAQDKLARDDLLLSRSGTIGRAFLVPEEASGMAWAGFLVRYIPGPDMDGRFLYYYAQSADFQNDVHADAVTSTIQNFNADRYDNMVVPHPPLDEQRAIADYLDQETAHIDALVAKQEEFIGLLRERRVAEVSSATTKGLRLTSNNFPNGWREGMDARVYDSNWYQDLPSGWGRGRVKSISQRVTDGAHISPETEDGRFDFVSTRDLKHGEIDFTGALKTSAETYAYMVRTGCQPRRGDVLFSKDGTVGTIAVVTTDHKFVVASSLIIISPIQSVMSSSFLNYALASRPVTEQTRMFTRGAGLPRISIANLASIDISIPPIGEQVQITRHLDEQTSRIDALIAKTEEHIALAKERRAALITAAVTGQFDVRTARKVG